MSNRLPEHAAVWFEVPVTDLRASAAFYGKVLETELKMDASMGPEMAIFPTRNGGVGGSLYTDAGAVGSTAVVVHLSSPTPLEGALDRVAGTGGQVVSDIITLPSGGRFAYCLDIDGNRFGLFTPA